MIGTYERMWREFFQSLEIGDRVQVTDQVWAYRNLDGIIVDKTKGTGQSDGVTYYLVRFKEKDLKRIDMDPSAQHGGFSKYCRGYFRYKQLKLL